MYILFNGISSEEEQFGIETIIDVRRQILPATRDATLRIPGRDGVFDFGRDYRSREIRIELLMAADTVEGLRDKVRHIADWLNVKEAKPLIFSDEPDKRYMARPTGGVRLEQIINSGLAQVNFLLPDVYAESTEEQTTGSTGVNEGTVETSCVIEVELLSHTTEGYLKVILNETGEEIIVHHYFQAGDILEIDTAKRLVKINGEDERPLVDVDSIFFKLPPGNFSIVTDHEQTSVTVKYRHRWI